MTKLTVTHEYSGFSDYWGGNGRRWDDDAGCLFAYYGNNTTLRDCVEQWIDDFNAGGDCDSFPDGITDSDLRKAILDSLTDRGRADYENDAICDLSLELQEHAVCDDCSAPIGEEHDEGCTLHEGEVFPDDCDNDSESPIWVILVECSD